MNIRGTNIGIERPNARMDDVKVRAMRCAYASGQSIRSLARDFHVSESVAWRVCHRFSWKHVTEEK